MSVKKPIVLYDGLMRRIQPGDMTPGQSEARDYSETMKTESLAYSESVDTRFDNESVAASEVMHDSFATVKDKSVAFSEAIGNKSIAYSEALKSKSIAYSESVDDRFMTKSEAASEALKESLSAYSTAINTKSYAYSESVDERFVNESVAASEVMHDSFATVKDKSVAFSEAMRTSISTVSEGASECCSIAESTGTRAESMARLGIEHENEYGIAMGADREGKIVGIDGTGSYNVVLAKASEENKMPAIGVIMEDDGSTIRMRAINELYDSIAIDSDAVDGGVSENDKLFVSGVESGKLSNIPPEEGVNQFVATVYKMNDNGTADINFRLAQPVYL